jgi:DNA-binding winged helix-turn-helix (wHTH) protein/tetratricopeptide (TPR) repeat protein
MRCGQNRGGDGGPMAPRDDEAAYVFDGFRLDPVQGMLFDPEGGEVRLRPKPFALLRHLLDHPGRLFGREELLDALWPGVVVTDDALTQSISDLRRALGEHAAAILRTVPRRGYMLASTVTRQAAVPPAPQPSPAAAPAVAAPPIPPHGAEALPLAMQRRDSVVVLPGSAPPGDEVSARLAASFTEDLLTELVRFEELRVLGGQHGTLSSGFGVQAHVHTAGSMAHASVRVTDLRTGTTFWADRLEWPIASGAPSVSAIAVLAGALDLQIGRKSLRRAEQKPLQDRTARECCLVGRSLLERADDMAGARALFVRAASLDPGYSAAYAWQAFAVIRLSEHADGEAERQAQTQEAVRLARAAVQCDPDSALSRAALALALALDGRLEEAAQTARLGLRYTGTTQHGRRTACAEALAVAGYPQEAVEALRETLAYDPHCPPRTRAVFGRALLLAGRPEDALRELRLCAVHLPDLAHCQGSIVVAAIEAGLIEDAQTALGHMRRLHPEWARGRKPIPWFLRRPEDLKRFEEAFQVAARLEAAAASGGLMKATTTRS